MTALAIMQSKSSNPEVAAAADATLKLDEIKRLNEGLAEKNKALVSVCCQVMKKPLDPKCSSIIGLEAAYYQKVLKDKISWWQTTSLSDSTQWFAQRTSSALSEVIGKIWDARIEFQYLSAQYAQTLGILCWYEARGFSTAVLWQPKEGLFPHIAERGRKYEAGMKSSMDSLSSSVKQFSL